MTKFQKDKVVTSFNSGGDYQKVLESLMKTTPKKQSGEHGFCGVGSDAEGLAGEDGSLRMPINLKEKFQNVEESPILPPNASHASDDEGV